MSTVPLYAGETKSHAQRAAKCCELSLHAYTAAYRVATSVQQALCQCRLSTVTYLFFISCRTFELLSSFLSFVSSMSHLQLFLCKLSFSVQKGLQVH